MSPEHLKTVRTAKENPPIAKVPSVAVDRCGPYHSRHCSVPLPLSPVAPKKPPYYLRNSPVLSKQNTVPLKNNSVPLKKL
jgi:hypothetical protein